MKPENIPQNYKRLAQICKGLCAPQAELSWIQQTWIHIRNKHTHSLCPLHTKCRIWPSKAKLNQTERLDWEVFVFTTDSMADF